MPPAPQPAAPARPDLVTVSPAGLACEAGGFVIDPWGPCDVAVVTHAHSDHLRPGAARYLCAGPSVPLLRRRLPPGSVIEGLAYGERRRLGATTISLHPAGHVLGSAQVRIEQVRLEGGGAAGATTGAGVGPGVWVVTGDWKRAPDPTCAPLEVVPCDVLVTEATFALPIHRWPPAEEVVGDIVAWWDACRARGRTALLFCYALGKAQRLLAELAPAAPDRTVWLHGAIASVVELYRRAGVAMAPTRVVSEAPRGTRFAGELVLAPPSAHRSPWLRRLGEVETALASGWMRIRGVRRRRGLDRGFVLSDHADWPAILELVRATGARRVLATHGHADVLARHLREQGLEAGALATEFAGEADLFAGPFEPPDDPAPDAPIADGAVTRPGASLVVDGASTDEAEDETARPPGERVADATDREPPAATSTKEEGGA